MGKYARLRSRLLASGEFAEEDFRVPEGASDAEICRAHCPDYLRRVATGALDEAQIRAIGFPWSERMVERSRRSSGATLAAARRPRAAGPQTSPAARITRFATGARVWGRGRDWIPACAGMTFGRVLPFGRGTTFSGAAAGCRRSAW
jgi:hypothetical protein